MEYFATYPYLAACLLLFVISVLLFFVPGINKQAFLWSAALSAPTGFLSVFFVPAYWDPVCVIEWGKTGFEDLLFSFVNGGIVWVLAIWPLRHKLSVEINGIRVFARFIFLALPSLLLGSLAFVSGIEPMAINFILLPVICIFLLWQCNEGWKIMIGGAFLFAMFYMAVILFAYTAFPNFISQWNQDALSGYMVWGVPIEELLWSLSYGATWPLFMLWVFEARWIESRKGKQSRGGDDA